MTEQQAQPSHSDVILVTGMAGGGKSVAMHALEDAGFFCVDNLPAELLLDFLALERQRGDRRVAIAVDVRSAGSLPMMHTLLKRLRADGVNVRSIFLDANTEALMRRFSETRRPHPLRQDHATGFGLVTLNRFFQVAKGDVLELAVDRQRQVRAIMGRFDEADILDHPSQAVLA